MNTPLITADVITRAKQLGRETEDVLLTSLRTEFQIARTFCLLARNETEEARSRYVGAAETGLQTILQLTERITIREQDRATIEEIRRDIVQLGGCPDADRKSAPEREF